jgi:actin
LQAILSLYGAGRTTGLVLDSGDGVTHTIPIYEGYAFAHCVKRLNLAGRDLSAYFMSLMADKGEKFSTTAEREVAREIKEKLCYVSLDFDAEYKNAEADPSKFESSYTLPDGKKIVIGKEKFLCPELLFKPSLMDLEEGGIHRVVFDTIQDCEIDIRSAMYGNIVLSGGSTMFPNLSKRLENEIAKLMPNRDLLKEIYAPDDRKFSVWIGGSILAPLKAFQEQWITKDEYEEYGVNIVHQKCIY